MLTKPCKICSTPINIPSGKRRPFQYCSPKCKKVGSNVIAKTAAQKAWRERKKTEGLCRDCNTPCAPYATCTAHRRAKTEQRHKTGESKLHYLGSKLSPERANYTLKIVKSSNPILAKHWHEVSPWLVENFELYTEHYDSVFYNYHPLNMCGPQQNLDDDDFVIYGYYSQIGNPLTLEDYVIAKVDAERARNMIEVI